ncbi:MULTISPECIES: helix-turn-helix domain-containing protein [Pseudonocardiaceae]|uniref:XRE family transcriptional regulator n=1 Tax=Prauserella endophytica TaxID=1592324 RepID=A0ABY2RSI6_9PSEU|nr:MULTISPECIES: XRE family transcriptional regulator [Pseudonocardiaceae]TKG58466.1 XRE family transcriptional regulator [Prauserella endophytica]
MSSTRRYPPNTKLAWERLQHGWSRQELVNQIKRSMELAGDGGCGLTADTARRWESGERWPEPQFRKHLVLVLGKPATELGLLTDDELALAPTEAQNEVLSPEDRQLDGLACQVMTSMWDMGKGNGRGISRQTFLRILLAVASTVPLLPPDLAEAADTVTSPNAAARDPKVLAGYSDITARHRQLYWTSPPGALLEATVAHTQLGVSLLRARPASSSARELASSVTESALQAARLAFFDIGQPELAAWPFLIAQQAVDLARDSALAAAVAAHRSFVPGFRAAVGDAAAARALLEVASAHARYAGGPRLRSWLHCVAAEVQARTGDTDASRDRIRQAQEALHTEGADPEWLDFFDESRLAGFAGNAELLAGRHKSASRWLQQAIENLPQSESKQRTVLLFDLALAAIPNDPDKGASLVHSACEELERNPYAAAALRIPAVTTALTGTPYEREIADRTHGLLPSVPALG